MLMSANHGRGRLGNFYQEHFPVFYQSQNVIHDLNEMKYILLKYYYILYYNSNSVETYWEKAVRNELRG